MDITVQLGVRVRVDKFTLKIYGQDGWMSYYEIRDVDVYLKETKDGVPVAVDLIAMPSSNIEVVCNPRS